MRTKLIATLSILSILVAACGDASADYETSDTFPIGRDAPHTTIYRPQTQDTVQHQTTDTTVYSDVTFEDPGENPEVDTRQSELSTFALDVDTGSYTIGRHFIENGSPPDPDSVRPEEYVNYFTQDYPEPRDDTFSVWVDGGPTPYTDQSNSLVVRIGIQAEHVTERGRVDANLTFIIDTSGSMGDGGRLEMVKEALRTMVSQLRSTDQVAIVECGSQAREVLPPTRVREERDIIRAIDRLRAGGSTNAADGLRLGYRLASDTYERDAINRVILASDGVANVGITDSDGLLDLIRRDADRGIHLVTVGVGMGNYNDALLEQLADGGDGFYAYVDDIEEADKVFVYDLTGTLVTVADDARVQVAWDGDNVWTWRLIGFENRVMDSEDFRNDWADAGEIGAGHSVTALYEVELSPRVAGATQLGTVYLRWTDPETGRVEEIAEPIWTDHLRQRFSDTAPRFQMDVMVAEFAEILRNDNQNPSRSLDRLANDVLSLRRWFQEDPDVAEFISLVDRAARLGR